MANLHYYEIDVSRLSDAGKKLLYETFHQHAFLFDEVDLGWRVSTFHVLPYKAVTIDEFCKEFSIPDGCFVRPYWHQ